MDALTIISIAMSIAAVPILLRAKRFIKEREEAQARFQSYSEAMKLSVDLHIEQLRAREAGDMQKAAELQAKARAIMAALEKAQRNDKMYQHYERLFANAKA